MKKCISKSNSVKVIRELKQALECKICYNTMTDKIFQCKIGHLICERCKSQCISCPYCKESIDTRSIFLENLLQNFTVKCPYPKCSIKCKYGDLKNHTNTCKHKPISCPFCNDKISPDHESITKHLHEKHEAIIQIIEQNRYFYKSLTCTAYQYEKHIKWRPYVFIWENYYFIAQVQITNHIISLKMTYISQETTSPRCAVNMLGDSYECKSSFKIQKYPTWNTYLTASKNMITQLDDETHRFILGFSMNIPL